MGRARGVLAGIIGLLVLATCALPAYATKSGGATYRRDGTNTSLEVDITATNYPVGVYALGPAFRTADISFDRGSSFVGTLYACDVKNADADDSGSVDATAGCDSLASISGDVTSTDVRIKRRFLVLDVDTAEGAGTTSRLTIFGSFGVGGGSGVPVAEYDALASVNPASTPFVKVSDCDDIACASPGTGSTHVPFYYTGSAWAPFPGAAAGIASVEADPAPVLGGDLDGDENEVENVAKFNKVVFPTMATLQTAIDACQNGSNDSDPACKIWLPPGRHPVTSTIRVGGVVLGEMQNGFELAGHGAGILNSLGNPLSGTTLYWAGVDGGTVLEVTGFGHWVHDIHIEGRSCTDLWTGAEVPQISDGDLGEGPDGNCDSDGSTTQVQAAYGIKQTGDNSASTPAGKNVYERILITGVLDASAGYGVALGDGSLGHNDQNDQTIFEQIRFVENRHCILHTDSQALANEFRMIDCTHSTASPAIDLQYGGVVFSGGFMGNDLSDATGFAVDYCMTEVTIDGIAFENFGGGVYRAIDSVNGFGGACGYGNNYQSRISNNRIQMLADSSSTHYCIDWDAHGSLLISGNTWMSNSSASARKCAINLPLPGTRDRFITMLGNKSSWNNGSDATDVAITVSAAGGALNKVLRGDRGRWEILDKDGSFSIGKDATGPFVDIDNNGTFDGSDKRLTDALGGAGTATYVPYYTGATTLGSESTFTYNNSTNTARASIMQGSSALVAGVDDTTDGTITIHDNSTNNQINLLIGNPSADLDFILPDDYGLSGDCIATDGAGTLYFDTCGSGGGGNVSDNTAEAITGVWEIQDDTNFNFGNDADFAIEYDEGVDNQLLLRQAGTQDPTATTDPIVEVLVEATPPADQQVFGVAKGSQSSNTPLFTVDEDGDAVATGTVAAASFDSTPDATAGGAITLKEGADDGVNTWTVKIPDSGGLSGDVTHTLTAGGKLPANAIAQTFTECFPLYAPTDTITGTDSIQSLWRAPAAITITEVWCETDTGTVSADLQIDDGSPADIMGADLVCDTSGETDSSSLTGSMADGDRLDLAITSVASSPTRLTFCAEYTYN